MFAHPSPTCWQQMFPASLMLLTLEFPEFGSVSSLSSAAELHPVNGLPHRFKLLSSLSPTLLLEFPVRIIANQNLQNSANSSLEGTAEGLKTHSVKTAIVGTGLIDL